MEEFQAAPRNKKGRHEVATNGSAAVAARRSATAIIPRASAWAAVGNNRTAVKVWGNAEYRNLDDTVELGTLISRSHCGACGAPRSGAAEELDLDGTIAATARNAGWLDLLMRPERQQLGQGVDVLRRRRLDGRSHQGLRRAVLGLPLRVQAPRVLLLPTTAAYDWVWKDSHLRHKERISTLDVIHRYGGDYKLIFVGDATMSPYEIIHQRGAIDYANEGLVRCGCSACWTPTRGGLAESSPSGCGSTATRSASSATWPGERMYPLTIDGLGRAIRQLSRSQRGS